MITHKVEQRSDEWKRLRLGKITGTRIKEVMAKDNMKLVDQLIAEHVSDEIEDDGFVNAAMQRGIDYEPIARQHYEKVYDCKVEQFGFIQSSKYPWLGYSPDGIINKGSDKHCTGIEIKCPSTAAHVRYIRQGILPTEYKYQIYAAFLVCENMKWLSFISYDSRFKIRPHYHLLISRDSIAHDLQSVQNALDTFWIKYEAHLNKVIF